MNAEYWFTGEKTSLGEPIYRDELGNDWREVASTPDRVHLVRMVSGVAATAEMGRLLASEREDLIAAGVDPAALVIPLHPDSTERKAT